MAGSELITGAESTGEKGNALHTEVTVTFDGVDISQPINEDLITLSFTDNEEDEADDLQIKLKDNAKKWLDQWLNDTMAQAAYGVSAVVVSVDKIQIVVEGFFNSYEYKGKGNSNADTVEILYNLLLGRNSDPGGKAAWTTLLDGGTPLADVINGFLGSQEFTNHWDAETFKPSTFVTNCYNIILGRDPDPAGYKSWMAVVGSDKGMSIQAGVKRYLPNGKIVRTGFGIFELDQLRASGPASSITIKGTSLPYSNGIRTEERDKSWEGYTLSRIGMEIASNGGLGFLYDCPDDPTYERIEQAKQTDIAFLMQLCHDAGKSLKISGMKLIIFDQAKYERMKSIETIRWMDGTYTKYDLSTQSGETHYDQCRLTYFDAASGTTFEGVANADDYDEEAKEHTICTITDRKVSSNEEAAELAAKILRLHNKYEKRVSFTLIGNPILSAGLAMNVQGFGLWDEKYIIKQCRHEISNTGYTTKITLRTIPEGRIEIEKAEEQAEEQKSGSTTNKKGKQVDKTWYTKEITKVYNGKDGDAGSAWVGTDLEVKVLGSTSGDRTLVRIGSTQGYVPTSAIERRETKKTTTKKGK